jgi:glycosyltransferase involved in cell wall biosynthesis
LIYHGISKLDLNVKIKALKARENLTLGYAGRFVEEKGIYILLESLKNFKFSCYKLIIKGAGPMEDYLRSYISSNTFSQNVIIETWEPVLEDFWQKIDLLVLPSIYEEGLGLIILEGMSHGKVVIASQIGAIDEMIINDFNGYLVEPNSPERLAERINNIYDNGVPELIIRNALQTADKFDLNYSINEYYDFYKSNNIF